MDLKTENLFLFWIGILFHSAASDREKKQLTQLIAEKEAGGV